MMARPLPELIAALRKGTCSYSAANDLHKEAAEALEALTRPILSRDDITRIALECADHDAVNDCFTFNAEGQNSIQAFAAMVAAAEREACAQACEGREQDRDWIKGSLYDTLRRESAAAIRARGEKGGS